MTEYRYDGATGAIQTSPVELPLPTMGFTISVPPGDYQLEKALEGYEYRGYTLVWVSPDQFVQNIASFTGLAETSVGEARKVYCCGIRSRVGRPGTGRAAPVLKLDEMIADACYLLADVRERLIFWLLDQRDLKFDISGLVITPNWIPERGVESEELYARCGAGRLGAPIGQVPDVPIILVDAKPLSTNVDCHYISARDGKSRPPLRFPVNPGEPRSRALTLACDAIFKEWASNVPVLVWRRTRTPDAKPFDRPSQRDSPPHLIIGTEWVDGGNHQGRSNEALHSAVQVAFLLMAEAQAALKPCLHHILNMTWRSRSDGRARRIVDAWFTAVFRRSGIPYLPWRGYGPYEEKDEAKPAKPAKPVKRNFAAMEESGSACDGFEEQQMPPRKIRHLMNSSMEVTRDVVEFENSRSRSPIHDSMQVEETEPEADTSDGGDVYPAVKGVHFPDPDQVLVELDQNAFYARITAQYNLCPSKAASLDSAPLPTRLAICDVIQRRVAAKAAGNASWNEALKSLLVCIYGIPGNRPSKYYSPRIRSMVAEKGRFHIRELRTTLVHEFGARILQSIADSVIILISPERFAAFMESTPYRAAHENGTILRLGDPIYMDALWCINDNTRVWLPRGQAAVTVASCKGAYPVTKDADPFASEAFCDFATQLLHAKVGHFDLVDAIRSAVEKSARGSGTAHMLGHLMQTCEESITQRWPGFMTAVQPHADCYALSKAFKKVVEGRHVQHERFELPKLALLRLDDYLGVQE